MLVEDDNNLREIYEARLLAEGYEIVSAKDGEEALAMAVKEKPDLIIADVMMPKISGFDMLDILRSTPETKSTKVIMMTALSQAEDKTRADKLGADRYLVKSQVTLEDVAKVAREVLGGEESADSNGASSTPTPGPTKDDVSTKPVSATASAPAPDPSSSTQIDPALAATLQEEEATIDSQINEFASQGSASAGPSDPTVVSAVSDDESGALDEPAASDTSLATAPPAVQISVKDAPGSSSDEASAKEESSDDEAGAKEDKLADAVNGIVKSTEPAPEEAKADESGSGDNVPIAHKKVIEPINDMSQKSPDLNELAAKEDQKEAVSPVVQADTTLPAEAVIQPGGATTTPKSEDEGPKLHKPGNVIIPGGGTVSDAGSEQPSDIAL